MADPSTAPSSSYTVLSSVWKLEGTQARCFRAGRWFFLGDIALIPGLVMLGDKLPGARGVTENLILLCLLAPPLLALVGLLMETTWLHGAGEIKVQRDETASGGKLKWRAKKTKETLPLGGFRAGWVSDATLELETQRRNVLRLTLGSPEEARRMLTETGLDARHRTVNLQLGPADFLTALLYILGPMVAFYGAMGIGFALSMPLLTLLLWLPLFALLRGGVRAYLGPAQLTIGADGVRIEQNLRTRFLPFSVIRDWEIQDNGVTFVQRDGERVRARGRHLSLDGKASAVVTRLNEAREVHLAGAVTDEARAQLARGGRSLADWRGALRGVLDRSGYRASSVSEDELWQVLASPQESAEMRLGAALALQERAPDELRPRLRVAAAACASPRLRVALEKLAADHDDDEALAAALDEDTRHAVKG